MRDPDKVDNRWSLQEEMEKVFKIALVRSFPEEVDEDPYILTIKNKEFGDFYIENVTSICINKPPQSMLLKHTAEAVMKSLPPNDMIEDCFIQNIGFLTIRLSKIWIAKSVHKMLNEGIETWAPKLPMKSAIVNFSSRNICEELDVGHLRPAIIGDMLARILDFSNVHVKLTNHFGDRMQFGMLIEFLFESFRKGRTIGEFEVFYKESKKRFDEDAKFRERAHQAQLGLQIGDIGYLNAWARICDMDQICYETVYERLGIHVEQLGEYFYYPHNQETLNLLRLEKGLIEEREGDQVIFVEENKTIRHHIFERKKKPLTVVKKNGYYDNALLDLTALRHGLTVQKAEWIVYVADVGRKEYIEMCFTAAKRARWLPTDEDEYPGTKFVGYGLVLGDDLNRSGKLVDLLDDAKTRCKASLLERGKADKLTTEELENTAETLGYGAVKYELLKDFRVFNYTLNVDEMLNDKGKTGVYLLYTHAQICSIINNSGKDIEELKKTRELILDKDEERELGLHLLQFTEVLEVTCTTVLPSILCSYLYELSKKFTSFYSVVCRADEEANRLLVCEATRVVMTKCFHLLGITPLDKISMTIPPAVDTDDDDDLMEFFSSDEDKKEMVSSSSSGEEKTPAKRFKSSDLTLEEEEIKMAPSLEPIKSSDLTMEEEKKDPNPRFQLFSANVHVDKYKTDCKPCFLFGSITVSDNSVSSEENGWVPIYDPDYGYTDLFFRDWSEPVPIVNDDYIKTLTHPRTHHSIPFIDFLHIRAELYVLSKDDNMLFQVGKTYTCLGLSNVTYDKFSTHILHGPDGFVKLVYIVLKDAVDADLEMKLITHPADYDRPLSVKIFAYYHGADYDYGSVPLRKDSYYITLLDDSVTMSDKTKIPLNTSVLAVPADGSLVIDVLIKDSNGNVIVKKIFDIPAERKGSSSCSSIDPVEKGGCSFKLNVNWI